jgi:hypothetical protein
VPGDEASDDIRNAQASLWQDGVGNAGPDSDALVGKLRERNGAGVHFSGRRLREHGAGWAVKVLPWLDQQWAEPLSVLCLTAGDWLVAYVWVGFGNGGFA